MIKHPAFEVDSWTVRESHLDLDTLAQTESVLALSNGHIGLRANLDEGEPSALPGTYLNGFYEETPLPYPESAYGYPEAGQSVVNATDGKVMRLLVDDEPFDVRYGRLVSHQRVLDFRDGVLRREVEWESPAGRVIRVSSTRMVSFKQRAVAAILYEVEAVRDRTRVVVQSELVANEPMPATTHSDPRSGHVPSSSLQAEANWNQDLRAVLVHTTAASRLRLAAGMDHVVEAPEKCGTSCGSDSDLARVTVAAELKPGQRLRVVKFLAYGWSQERSAPALRDQVEAALASARYGGWDGLLAEQREYLEDFWNGADVKIEGDAELQQAVRFALFHVLQSSARAEKRAIPAKGLTGPGYDGHTFWDTETFVLPVLTYTAPHAVADELRWRHSTLPQARERARQLGHAGAAFPWRTIHGEECSGYWPASTAAFHINADIADAVVRYQAATDDENFELEVGLELLVETARLWRSLGHHDREGRFRIDGVTGPDEYSALQDNNVYTNLMAQRNLRAAADAASRHPQEAAALGVGSEEAASWRDAAEAMMVPYDEELGVHPQSEGFTQHEPWDFSTTSPDDYPLLLHFPYFDLYRKQVVKQADLILALHWRGDAFSAEDKARDFAYYEPITVRDSSLSACTQAVVAAEVGHMDLAYDYLGEAALMDLADLEHNVRDGLHMGSLAGAWLAVVAGLGGMRDHDGELFFAPRLPAAVRDLTFCVCFRGRVLRVVTNHRITTYSLVSGEALDICHHGETLTVTQNEPVTRPVPESPVLPRPSQPPGREPTRRHN